MWARVHGYVYLDDDGSWDLLKVEELRGVAREGYRRRSSVNFRGGGTTFLPEKYV